MRRRPSHVPAEIEPRINIRISTGIRVVEDKAGVKAAREARTIESELEGSWRAKAGQAAQAGALALDGGPRAGTRPGAVLQAGE